MQRLLLHISISDMQIQRHILQIFPRLYIEHTRQIDKTVTYLPVGAVCLPVQKAMWAVMCFIPRGVSGTHVTARLLCKHSWFGFEMSLTFHDCHVTPRCADFCPIFSLWTFIVVLDFTTMLHLLNKLHGIYLFSRIHFFTGLRW